MSITSKEQMQRFVSEGWRPVVLGDDRFLAKSDYVVDLQTQTMLHRNKHPVPLALSLEVASILGLLPSPSSDGVVVPKEAYQHLIGAAHQAMDTLDTVYLGLCAVADDEACRVAKIGLSRAVAALPTTKEQEAK